MPSTSPPRSRSSSPSPRRPHSPAIVVDVRVHPTPTNAVSPNEPLIPHRFLTPFFVALMLSTGTINTLLNKSQDLTCVENCSSPIESEKKFFEQPVWQTLNMFVGEVLCLFVFYLLKARQEYVDAKMKGYALVGNRDSLDEQGVDAPVVIEELDEDGEEGEEEQILGAETVHDYHDDEDNSDIDQRLNDTEDILTKPLVTKSTDTDRQLRSRRQRRVVITKRRSRSSASSSIHYQDREEQQPKLKGLKNFYLWLPTLCDLTATTFMNVGLIYSAASIYQMLRGAVVFFTAILSTVVLKRHHAPYRWASLFAVVSGVALVGTSSLLTTSSSEGDSPVKQTSFIGVVLTLIAQCFTALQFILEELLISQYATEPLKIVGYEGLFGLVSIGLALPLGYLITSSSPSTPPSHFQEFFNIPLAWHQITSHPSIYLTAMGICLSIAIFNFAGLSITKHVSGTSRSMIDTCRTLLIWIVSLSLGWESFAPLQLVGFAVLVVGTLVFNDVIDLRRFVPSWYGVERVEEEVHS